jgi:hypothetical protein
MKAEIEDIAGSDDLALSQHEGPDIDVNIVDEGAGGEA